MKLLTSKRDLVRRWLIPPDLSSFVWFHLGVFIAFPFLAVVSWLFVGFNDFLFGIVIGIYAMSHLVVMMIQLDAFGRMRQLMIPVLIAAVCVFGSNRHVDGWIDSTPFGSSITMYDQRYFGCPQYLRIFDEPNSEYGTSEFEWGGFFLAIEFLVFLIYLMNMSVSFWLRTPWKSISGSVPLSEETTGDRWQQGESD